MFQSDILTMISSDMKNKVEENTVGGKADGNLEEVVDEEEEETEMKNCCICS